MFNSNGLHAIFPFHYMKFTSHFRVKTVSKYILHQKICETHLRSRSCWVHLVCPVASSHIHCYPDHAIQTHTAQNTPETATHRLFSICDSLQTTSLLLHIRVEFGYHADAVRSHVDELVWKQTAAVMLWDSNETQTEGWWRWWRVCTCVLHLGTSAVLIY